VDTCPFKQYVHALKTAIEQWQQDGNFLVIGGNRNTEISSPAWHLFWINLGHVSPAGVIKNSAVYIFLQLQAN